MAGAVDGRLACTADATIAATRAAVVARKIFRRRPISRSSFGSIRTIDLGSEECVRAE
jgi:hypothetical protein